jgi:hypothetical protein
VYDERQISVGGIAVALIIFVTTAVSLAVLLAPQLVPRRSLPHSETTRTWRLDGGNLQLVGWRRDDEHRAGGQAHDRFGD